MADQDDHNGENLQVHAGLDRSIAQASQGQVIPLDVFEAEISRQLLNPSSVPEWDADMRAGRCPHCHQEVADDSHSAHYEQYFAELRSRLGLPAQP